MKRLRGFGWVLLGISLGVSGVVACSDDASPAAASPDASNDGVATLPVDGGADTTAVSDASADVDAAPGTCTTEGWCHIVVPGKQTLVGIWGDGHGVVFTVTQQGNILRWDGKAWVQSFSAGSALYAIWGSSATDVWVGGESGLFHGTGASADTLTWALAPTPAAVSAVYSIWGSAANDVWAVGDTTPAPQSNPDTPDSVIHYSGPSDAGGWVIDPISASKTATYYQRVWGTGANDVWLIGIVYPTDPSVGSYVARLLRRQSGSWKDVVGPDVGSYSTPTYGGTSVSTDQVWLSGVEDTNFDCLTYSGIARDGGFAWTPQTPDAVMLSGTQVQDYAVWGTGPNDVWKAGGLGRLRHWNGSAWAIARVAIDNALPVQNTIYGIWGSGPGDVWAVGDDIALHKVSP